VTEATTFRYNLQGEMSDVLIDSFDSAGVKAGHEDVHYGYGPDGIRVAALDEEDSHADGTFDSRTRTEYLIDSGNNTDYQQVLQETVQDADTGAEVKKVVYTLGLDHIAQTTLTPGGPVAGETLVFHVDGHGSTRVLTDLLAAVVTVAGERQIFHYDAYGNAVGFSPSAAATAYLYSEEQLDLPTLLAYHRARYLDAGTGRFLTTDPSPGSRQAPLSLHPYLYATDNPVNLVDPSGLYFTLTGLTTAVSIVSILQSIGLYNILPALAIRAVVKGVWLPAFEFRYAAIDVLSSTGIPKILRAAALQYERANRLIEAGVQLVQLSKRIIDLLDASTSLTSRVVSLAQAATRSQVIISGVQIAMDVYTLKREVKGLTGTTRALAGVFGTQAQPNSSQVISLSTDVVKSIRPVFSLVLKLLKAVEVGSPRILVVPVPDEDPLIDPGE
jgi:RHS repeat-associated protein